MNAVDCQIMIGTMYRLPTPREVTVVDGVH